MNFKSKSHLTKRTACAKQAVLLLCVSPMTNAKTTITTKGTKEKRRSNELLYPFVYSPVLAPGASVVTFVFRPFPANYRRVSSI
jgi:hypothetical protein